MGRSLERRAEGIKGFFDSELRKVPYLPTFLPSFSLYCLAI
jgi:hypothetical protein